MFLCEECVPPEHLRMMMPQSRGKCENCGKVATCIESPGPIQEKIETWPHLCHCCMSDLEIDLDREYRNNRLKCPRCHKVCICYYINESTTTWQRLESAPKDGTYIQLLMDSGYSTTPYIIVIANYVHEYAAPWRTHANDSVFDGAHTIVAWSEWEPPQLNFTVPEGNGKYEYKMVKEGKFIKPGDEMQRDDEWIVLTQADIDGWMNVTGKMLTRKKGDLPVRRKVK